MNSIQCFQWEIVRTPQSSKSSSTSTTRECNVRQPSLHRISLNWATTSSIFGRFAGSFWTMPDIRGFIKSRPCFLCRTWDQLRQNIILGCRQSMTDYQKVPLYSIADVEDISRKRIAGIVQILKLRNSLVTTPYWYFSQISDWRIILARNAEINEMVFWGFLGTCKVFGTTTTVLVQVGVSWMKGLGIELVRIEHDVFPHTITAGMSVKRKLRSVTLANEQHSAGAWTGVPARDWVFVIYWNGSTLPWIANGSTPPLLQ